MIDPEGGSYVLGMTYTDTSADDTGARRTHRLLTTGTVIAIVLAIIALLLRGCGGSDSASAYDIWLDLDNTGTQQEFIDSLRGRDGATGREGAAGSSTIGSTGTPGARGATGSSGADGTSGAMGMTGAQGDSAYRIWLLLGNTGTEQDFIDSLRGPTGAAGAPGATGAPGTPGTDGAPGAEGPAGPPGPVGFGDVGSFWDETTQGDANINPGFLADTAYVMTFDHADTSNNRGVSITNGSEVTFTTAGLYNIQFSAQVESSQGGSANTLSIWLRVNGIDIPWTATDFTLLANSARLVTAWNFFVPVTCSAGVCDHYELVWSSQSQFTGLVADVAKTGPTRPAIPSIILTVSQVQ